MVGLAGEFLAIARDEQERVVGAGTEDQHRDDSRVEGQATRLADGLRDDARELVCEADDGQRDEPEDG